MNKLTLDYDTVERIYLMLDGDYVLLDKTVEEDYRQHRPEDLAVIIHLNRYLKEYRDA